MARANKETNTVILDSIAELVLEATAPAPDSYSERNRVESLTPGTIFPHDDLALPRGATSADVCRTLQTGWPEGTRRMQASAGIMLQVAPQAKPTRRMRLREDDGHELHIDRILTGRSDYWQAMVREPVKSERRVVLAINTGLRAMEDADNLIWRGAATLNAARMLQASRVTFTVVAYWSRESGHKGRSKPANMLVTIKPANAPLNEATLIAAIGHPATKRCLMHAAAFNVETRLLGAKVSVSLGYSIECGPDAIRAATGEGTGVPIIICPRSVSTESTARAWIDTIPSLIAATGAHP